MKKLIFIISIASLLVSSSNVKTYCDGYKEGFVEGYCYETGISCSAPVPNCPNLRNGEKNTYVDGKLRGHYEGYALYKQEQEDNK